MFNKTKNKNKYKKIKVFRFYSHRDIVSDRELDTFLKENDIINVNTSSTDNYNFITVVYWANK